MANREGVGDALTARLCIHAGAMPFSVKATDDAVFVERQFTKAREFSRQDGSLIESALTLTVAVQRNGNDYVGLIQRFALLHVMHQQSEAARHARFALQLQNRR